MNGRPPVFAKLFQRNKCALYTFTVTVTEASSASNMQCVNNSHLSSSSNQVFRQTCHCITVPRLLSHTHTHTHTLSLLQHSHHLSAIDPALNQIISSYHARFEKKNIGGRGQFPQNVSAEGGRIVVWEMGRVWRSAVSPAAGSGRSPCWKRILANFAGHRTLLFGTYMPVL